jgi:hypothetical protein
MARGVHLGVCFEPFMTNKGLPGSNPGVGYLPNRSASWLFLS